MAGPARRRSVLAFILLGALCQTGRAADYYWDTNSTTAGFGTASGTWGSSAFWSTNNGGTVAPTVTNTLVADNVFFGNGATGLGSGTIGLTGTSQGFTGMTFAAGSGAITISGTAGTLLTMGAASTITVNNAANTIDTRLVGAATSLTKSGDGRLTLSGLSATAANNYAGTTILNGGTLAIANTAGLTGGLTFNATPVTLDLTAGSATFAGTMQVSTNTTTGTSRITIGDGRTLTNTGAVGIGVNNSIAENTRLTVSGTGTAEWLVNAPVGFFRVGGGTTTVLDMSGLPFFESNLTTGTFVVQSNGNNINDSSTAILAQTSKITAGVLGIGWGTGNFGVEKLRLGTGANTIYANTIAVGAGVSGLQDNRGNGRLDFFDSSLGNVTIRAADGVGRATIDVINNTSNSGVGNTGAIVLTGHYADVLTGTVTIASRGSNATSSVSSGTVAFDTGVFDATQVVLSHRRAAGFTSGGTVGELTLGGGAVTLGTLTMAQNSGGVAGSTNTGDAIASLIISGGTVSIGSLTMGTNTVSGAANGSDTNATITITGGATTVSTGFTMGVQNSAADASTNVNRAVSTLNISGGSLTLSGTTNLVMAATTLDANNTASGTIAITGGSLTVGGNIQYTNGLGTETNTITLDGGLLDMTSGTIGAAAALITLNARSGTLQNLNQLNGGGALTKSTGGILTLAGTNTYSGTTTISEGVLAITSTAALPGFATAGRYAVASGAGLAVGNAVNDTAVGQMLATNNLASGAQFGFDTSAGDRTYGVAVEGSIGLVKIGANTLTLTATNTYSGTTTVSQGVLAISSTAALPGFATAGSYSVAAGAGLAVGNAVDDTAVGQMLATNNLASGAQFGFDTSAGDRTYGVALTGSIGLVKIGVNWLTLSSSNAYTGSTTVTGGSLVAGDAFAFGSQAGALVAQGGVLDLGGYAITRTGTVSFTGGTVQSGTITNDTVAFDARAGSVSASLAGSVGLAKTTNGTLTLSGSNSYTGATTVSSGSLVAGNAFAFGGQSGAMVAAGGVLDLGGYGITRTGTVSFTGGTVQSGTITNDTVAFIGQSGTVSASLAGSVGLTKTTSGTLTLSGTNTYSGSTTVSQGVLAISSAEALPGIATAGRYSVAAGAGLSVGNGVDDTAVGQIVATNNLASGALLGFDTSAGNRTLGVAVTGSMAVVKVGANSLTLSASNSYTGGTTITSGTVVVGDAAALGASTGALAVNGGTLDLSGRAVTVGLLAGSSGATITSNTTGSATLTANPANPADWSEYAGRITNGSGSVALVKSGDGRLTLSGSNSYSGGTTLNAGVLAFGTNGLGTSGAVTLNGGTLEWGIGNTQDLSARITLVSGSTATLDTNSNNVTLGSSFGGATSATLVKAGAGTLTLSASNSWTGGTTLSAGVLAFGTNGLGTSGAVRLNGGTLQWASGNTQDLSARITLVSGSTVTLNTNGNNVTLATGFGGTTSAALVKAGAGTLTLSASNSWTGGTTLSAGRLNINNASALGSGTFTISGASTIDNTSGAAITVSRNNAQNWNADFTFAGSNPLNLGTGTVTLSANRQVTVTSSTLTVGGAVGGAFSLTKAGAGTLMLTGSNTYSGTTTVSQGVLVISSTAALPGFATAGRYAVAAGAGLAVGNAVNDTAVGQMLATNNLASGAQFGFDTSAGDRTYGAAITGSIGLFKIGVNSLSLSGSNSYSGGTTLNAGVLSFGSDALGTTGNVTLNGGTLRWATGNTQDLSARLALVSGSTATLDTNGNDVTLATGFGGSTSAALVKTGAGTLTLSANNSYTGVTTISGGTLSIGDGGASGMLAGDLVNNAALVFNRSDASTYSGAMTGSGAITKLGAGKLTLTAISDFTGSTSVLEGTLAVNGSLANATLDVAAGATLMGSGTIAGLTTIAGLHSPGNSPGTPTLQNLAYENGATISWELWNNTTSNSPVAYDQVFVTGDLTFSGSTTLTLAFTGSASPTNYSTVAWSDTFWDTNQEWLFYQVTGTTSGYGNLAMNTTNWLDSTGAAFQTARQGSTFALENRAGDIYVTYVVAAVPEPGTLALAGVGLAIAGGIAVRRRRSRIRIGSSDPRADDSGGAPPGSPSR